MKKATTMFLAFVLTMSAALAPALAAPDASDSIQPAIGVEYAPADIAMLPATIDITDNGHGGLVRAYSVQDLGTNNSVGIDWFIGGKSSVRSSYNYKTASGKIVVRATATSTASIIFGLYDSTDTRIGEYTVEVLSSKTAILTFSNLFTNREYYVKAENASQTPTTLSGTIAAA